jgi:two-component system phosphate regulon sensor histidine kinase PhoR
MASIQQHHTQTETLLSHMVEGVLAVDRGGKAVFANTAFCRMFGLKEERIQGKSLLEMVRNDQLSEFIASLRHDPSAPESKEVSVFSADGERTFSVQSSRILESPEGEGLLLLVFHDITGIKRLEQMRRDFVANVSHELRTPLTALIGSTEILLDGMHQKPQESRRFLEIMDKQLRNIQNLVSDMLRLAAVEDVRTPFRRSLVSIKDFAEDVIESVKALAEKKQQQIKAHLPAEAANLTVDREQLSAAVVNLLDNAVKYTQERGTIELCVSLRPESVRIAVRDNGPGIPREVQPRIFERFYRVDKSRSREMGGTGLGLAIARHAVENHGGSLTVQSEPGKGAVFTIELPESCLSHATV